MGIVTFIKITAGVLMLGVVSGTAWLVLRAKENLATPQVEQDQVVEMLEAADMPDIEPGERAFQKAHELIALGQTAEAKEKLLYIVNFCPGSPAAAEARRILGEMNLDELLSSEHLEGKEKYTVKRGDSYLAIAAAHHTTLDCLMHLNGLLDLDRLRPGDELLLMSLGLRVVIDPGRKTLTLWDGNRFVKEYRMLATVAPGAGQKTKIEGKGGLVGERRLQAGMKGYRDASKWIQLGKGVPTIGTGVEGGGAGGKGYLLSGPDMEELSLVLRVGNEVEILPKST
jgi:hypothetical protein